MAADAQNKSRRRRDENIYEGRRYLNTTQKREPEARQDLLWLWPPKHITNPEHAEIQTFTKPMSTQRRHKKQNRGKERIYDGYGHRLTKQIQKTQKTKQLRNLWEPIHDTKKQNQRKNQIYDGCGHRRTKQSQKTQNSKHLGNLWAPKRDTKKEPEERTNLRWLWPLTYKTKSRRGRNPNIYETCEHLNTAQKTEPGEKTIYNG